VSKARVCTVPLQVVVHDSFFGRSIYQYSQVINSAFSFAGISTSSQFIDFPSTTAPPAVAITGRTYHYLQDAETSAHSIHWLLYDQHARSDTIAAYGIQLAITQTISGMLQRLNPCVHSQSSNWFDTTHVSADIVYPLKW